MEKILIAMYHYVRPIKKSNFTFIKGLEVEDFISQINYLQKNYEIIGMDILINFIKNKVPLPKKSCLLTFDDGYKDHYLYVYPELKKRGLLGSFFPVGSTILENKILDVNKIHFILAKGTKLNFIIDDIKDLINGNIANLNNNNINNFEFYWKNFAVANSLDTKETIFVKRLLQHALPKTVRSKFCDFLFKKYVGLNEKEFSSNLYMSKSEINEMIKENMYFGCHTYNHPWLNTLSTELQTIEIQKGLDFLKNIGASTSDWVMNYPYGAYNNETINVIKKLGCCLALTTSSKQSISTINNNYFELPRTRTNNLPLS